MLTKDDKFYSKKLSRRALLLGGVQGGLASLLAIRLYYLQITENQRFSDLSDRNKYDFRILPPSRGRIFDSQGRLLAANAETFALHVIADRTPDLRGTLEALGGLINLDDSEIESIIEEAAEKPGFMPVLIRDNLNQREVSRVVIRSPSLPGVEFKKLEKRVYPQGAVTCHVTGFVSRVTEEEIRKGQISPELAALFSGKAGIERSFEKSLRGQPGRERIIVSATGKAVRTAIDESARAGADLNLTLNLESQSYAVARLRKGNGQPQSLRSPQVSRAIAADPDLARHLPAWETMLIKDSKGRIVPPESGAVVVLDVQTGGVVTMASAPMFDPNVFSSRISQPEWASLMQHPRTPLLNRCLAGQYAPGSTFKMIVALAALEAGVISSKTRFYCPGHRDLGNATFHCWLKNGHGNLDVVGALEQSCDVFFYELGLKTGIAKIAAMARKLGLGMASEIDLPGEKNGNIPDKKWKMTHVGAPWTPGETVIAAIGQGYVLVTPMQLAVMTARLANGSKAVSPYLVQSADEKPTQLPPLDISPAALRVIKQGMEKVVVGSHGTARQHGLDLPGIEMAGKTGTVQVRRISKAEREIGIVDNMDRPWKYRDHALFIGYAPQRNPRYAIAVIVEHGGSGSSMAAPIARDVLRHLFSLERQSGGAA